MHILVTGAAGFIGHALTQGLLRRGDSVFGVDNLSTYYDVRLKQARVDRLKAHPDFRFELIDIASRQGMASLFAMNRFDAVVHLAAQAGVRYSLTNPHAYVDANLVGFINVLEGARNHGAKQKLRFFLISTYANISQNLLKNQVNVPYRRFENNIILLG